MTIALHPLDPSGTDREALVAFRTENEFPFHVTRHPARAGVLEAIDAGGYDGDENETFWLIDDHGDRVGIVRLEDLTDPTPLFDLRLAEEHRGRGPDPRPYRRSRRMSSHRCRR